MDKPKQETVTQSDQLNNENWKETLSKVRHNSTDDNKINSEIKEVEVKEETANIKLSPQGFDKIIECHLDASIDPNQRSEFEIFLDNLGYNISEDGLFTKIQDEECLTSISRSNGAINICIDDSLLSVNENNKSNEKLTGLLVGYFLGALPFVNLMIIYSANREIISRRADNNISENPYFLTGFSTSMTIYALVLPYLVATF